MEEFELDVIDAVSFLASCALIHSDHIIICHRNKLRYISPVSSSPLGLCEEDPCALSIAYL